MNNQFVDFHGNSKSPSIPTNEQLELGKMFQLNEKWLYSLLMSTNTTIEKLHEATCARKENGYMDPKTGFFVLSAYYLRSRGQCCGTGCRHCPYSAEEQQRAGRREIRNENLNTAQPSSTSKDTPKSP